MTDKQKQLAWEERWAKPAAIAAFLAAISVLAEVVLLQSSLEQIRGLEPLPEFYVSIDRNSGTFLASGAARAVAGLSLMGVFLYLFRAAMARGAGIPSWFVYLVVIGPLIYGLNGILTGIDQLDKADQFVEGGVLRGAAGEDAAEELRDDVGGIQLVFLYVGSISVAFLFVMLPLRARRVGLLSPFMGILGVIVGALIVLPLLPPIIQVFWLGALGTLFLGNWPGGRGPAWESGEPDPWPSAAERRGLVRPEPNDESLLDPSDRNGADGQNGADGPGPPQRPASRKRKRRP